MKRNRKSLRGTGRVQLLVSTSFILTATLCGCGEQTPASVAGQTPAGAEQTVENTVSEASNAGGTAAGISVSTEELLEHDFLLYVANCGVDKAVTAPEGQLGLYQSLWDMPVGADPVTGMTWGYEEMPYMTAQGDTESADPSESKWEIAEGTEYEPEETGFYYSFQVPEGTYEVTCGFSNPFSARTVSIDAEGQQAVSDHKILKFQDIPAVFRQTVTDGELNLKIYNPNRGKDAMKNPILSYIEIRVVPEYNEELMKLLLEKTDYSEEELQAFTTLTASELKQAREAAGQALEAGDAVLEEPFLNLKQAAEALELRPVYDAFHPGEVWLDTEGTPIQAHGGQIQKLPVKNEATGEMEEKWWWVGEDKTLGYRGGICAYSSEDLYNWQFEGVIMRNVNTREQLDTEEYFTSLYEGYTKEQLDNVYLSINDSTSIIERPKLIYNEKTDKYLLWFHADEPTADSDASYAAACAGVAVSDSPAGPFRFIDRYRLNVCPEDQEDMYPQSRGMARDMNLFTDEDGTAYIIYSSEENLTIYISKLNEEYDYLCTTPEKAVYGVDFIRLYPGAQREAPAMIKKDGTYYLMTSGATGWNPNKARYWRADEIFGDWEDMGDPCIGDENETTFASQSTCIFEADNGEYIYMGDRWNSDDLAASRYVWLPVTFTEQGEMSLKWQDEWRLN